MQLLSGKLAGPALEDRRVIWRAFAASAGGTFEEGKRASKDRVLFRHRSWIVVLETYQQNNGQTQVTYTRARAYFQGYEGLRLTVRRKNLFDRVWAALGFGRTLPVSPELLERFVVTGKPATRVPSLLASSAVLDAARAAESFHLDVKPPGWRRRRTLGDGVGVVACRAHGVVRDPVRLEGLVSLVRETLDGLHRVGAANEVEVPAP